MTSRRILFLVSAHNSLSQRAWIELTERGHDVTVEVVDSSAAMEAAVHEHDPELIVCPMLKKIIPASIWSQHCCLVVHPGPLGDRGPSSLDWAVELDQPTWGVTVLQANDDVDGGDVWATEPSLSVVAARAACTGTRCAGRRSRPWSRPSASSTAAGPRRRWLPTTRARSGARAR